MNGDAVGAAASGGAVAHADRSLGFPFFVKNKSRILPRTLPARLICNDDRHTV